MFFVEEEVVVTMMLYILPCYILFATSLLVSYRVIGFTYSNNTMFLRLSNKFTLEGRGINSSATYTKLEIFGLYYV